MTSLLVTGIGELTTNDRGLGDGSPLGLVADAAMVVEGGRVAWVGESAAAPEADQELDVDGAAVVPGFVDSHAHLVFAGDRAREFDARMKGEPYSAGGIRTTVAATRAASGRGAGGEPRAAWLPRWPGRARRPWRSRAATG